jgi:hypothetical protein
LVNEKFNSYCRSKEVPAEIQLKLDRLEEIQRHGQPFVALREKNCKEVKEIKADLKSSEMDYTYR